MRKMTSLLLAAVMVLSMAACGSPAETTKAPETTAPSTAESSTAETTVAPTETEPEAPVEKIIRLRSGNCGHLNPLNANDAESDYCDWCQARLYRRFVKEDRETVYLRPELAEAEPVDVNGDGVTWNIKIRDDACFDDGTPITAETFEYTYKMCLDPVLVQRGGDLVGTYFSIVNAKAYFKGECKNWDEVGIKAIDGNILQITAENAISPELIMKEFATYTKAPVEPVLYESCLSADRATTTYGTTPELCRYSGAYKIDTWVKESKMIVSRNEKYVYNDEIKLTGGELIYVNNNQTAVEMYENGELDILSLGPDVLDSYIDSPDLFTFPSRSTVSMNVCSINTNKPILQSLNLKKALWYAIDRETLAKLDEATPINFWVPLTSMVDENGTRFRDTDIAKSYTPPIADSYNPELAMSYYEEALKEVGKDSETLELLINSDNATMSIAALFIQEQFNKVFQGKLEIKIVEQPSSVAIAQRKSWRENPNAYELTFTSWARAVTDFDPLSAFDVLSSSYYAAVPAPFNDPVIEELIWYPQQDGTWRTDMNKNIELAAKMEQSVMENFTTIPIFEKISAYLVNERVILALNTPKPSLGMTIPAWMSDVAE